MHTGGGSLELPVRPVAAPDEVAVRPCDDPVGAPPLATTVLDPGEYRWHVPLDAFEGGTRVCSRNWHLTVPRDLV